jgi:hypothetical protein
MIFWFPPYHWNCKWHSLSLAIQPLCEAREANSATNVGSPTFILISNFTAKVVLVCSLNSGTQGLLLVLWCVFATYVTKKVRMVDTTTSIHYDK